MIKNKLHIVRKVKGSILTFIFFNLSFIILQTSCGKFEDLNTNPNEPTVTNPDFLFTESIISGTGRFSTGVHTEIWTLMRWQMMMADSSGVPSLDAAYNFSGAWNDELWTELYTRGLAPCNEIIRLTEGDPFLINKHSVARIWRAYLFHRLTDLYGDIPYSEALLGAEPNGEAILTPGYDRQEDIYSDLLNELSEAVAALESGGETFGAADIFYSGDVDAWRRFGNSLRLRLALRISNKKPELAEPVVRELMTQADLISNNNQGALFRPIAGIWHPFFELDNTGQGMYNPSQFLVDHLKATNDPRIGKLAEPTLESTLFGNPDWTGIPNLQTSSELSGFNSLNTSGVGNYFLDGARPGVTLGYAEVCFLQAEAAWRGWGDGQPASAYYEAGVRAHCEYLGVPDSSIVDFLAGPGAYDGTLENIITQKWLTFVYRDGYEGFAELRRTGFPALKEVNGTPLDLSTVPQRLLYPPSEINLNSANVPPTDVGLPVWWAE